MEAANGRKPSGFENDRHQSPIGKTEDEFLISVLVQVGCRNGRVGGRSVKINPGEF